MHIPALAWGAFVEISGRVCPLTTLENHFRAAAGQKGYEGGFIDQMLLSVIYPDLPPWTHAAMGIGLLLFNVLLYVYLLRTRTIQKGLRNYDP